MQCSTLLSAGFLDPYIQDSCGFLSHSAYILFNIKYFQIASLPSMHKALGFNTQHQREKEEKIFQIEKIQKNLTYAFTIEFYHTSCVKVYLFPFRCFLKEMKCIDSEVPCSLDPIYHISSLWRSSLVRPGFILSVYILVLLLCACVYNQRGTLSGFKFVEVKDYTYCPTICISGPISKAIKQITGYLF